MDDSLNVLAGCPHGLPRPYCPMCGIADLDAEAAERKRRREQRSRETEREQTVAAQSKALDEAYAYIQRLERRVRGQ